MRLQASRLPASCSPGRPLSRQESWKPFHHRAATFPFQEVAMSCNTHLTVTPVQSPEVAGATSPPTKRQNAFGEVGCKEWSQWVTVKTPQLFKLKKCSFDHIAQISSPEFESGYESSELPHHYRKTISGPCSQE